LCRGASAGCRHPTRRRAAAAGARQATWSWGTVDAIGLRLQVVAAAIAAAAAGWMRKATANHCAHTGTLPTCAHWRPLAATSAPFVTMDAIDSLLVLLPPPPGTGGSDAGAQLQHGHGATGPVILLAQQRVVSGRAHSSHHGGCRGRDGGGAAGGRHGPGRAHNRPHEHRDKRLHDSLGDDLAPPVLVTHVTNCSRQRRRLHHEGGGAPRSVAASRWRDRAAAVLGGGGHEAAAALAT
jgi:hypothetical protein